MNAMTAAPPPLPLAVHGPTLRRRGRRQRPTVAVHKHSIWWLASRLPLLPTVLIDRGRTDERKRRAEKKQQADEWRALGWVGVD